MNKQEKQEHIKVFKKILVKIDKNPLPFICNLLDDLDAIDTLKYFKSQKPNNKTNKEFFKDFEKKILTLLGGQQLI